LTIRIGAYLYSGDLQGAPLGKATDLPANIILSITNALAYYSAELITVVKSFMMQAKGTF
jgi:hypothetical protein